MQFFKSIDTLSSASTLNAAAGSSAPAPAAGMTPPEAEEPYFVLPSPYFSLHSHLRFNPRPKGPQCHCGTWQMWCLPPHLGGCGHLYVQDQLFCGNTTDDEHPERALAACCAGVVLRRPVRSAGYMMGLCPTCRQDAAVVQKYNQFAAPFFVPKGLSGLALMDAQEVSAATWRAHRLAFAAWVAKQREEQICRVHMRGRVVADVGTVQVASTARQWQFRPPTVEIPSWWEMPIGISSGSDSTASHTEHSIHRLSPLTWRLVQISSQWVKPALCIKNLSNFGKANHVLGRVDTEGLRRIRQEDTLGSTGGHGYRAWLGKTLHSTGNDLPTPGEVRCYRIARDQKSFSEMASAPTTKVSRPFTHASGRINENCDDVWGDYRVHHDAVTVTGFWKGVGTHNCM
ncbi:hypothetical protein BU17DRAFT_67803 [Hysterangium stoloniferum]|nr:hypothetical protein BU17DRAFT_67803 [Hysterangium stoloniferum]